MNGLLGSRETKSLIFCEKYIKKKKKNQNTHVLSAAIAISTLAHCMLGNFACFIVVCGLFFF